MARAGDSYEVTLIRAYLEWGVYRFTNSRGIVYGEGYLPIPADAAYKYQLLNANGTGGRDILGQNIFNCTSADGDFSCTLKAEGNQNDSNFAKQLAGNDNLKALGDWFYAVNASVGDVVRITWTSPTDVVIKLL